jgi:hypothetical protein
MVSVALPCAAAAAQSLRRMPINTQTDAAHPFHVAEAYIEGDLVERLARSLDAGNGGLAAEALDRPGGCFARLRRELPCKLPGADPGYIRQPLDRQPLFEVRAGIAKGIADAAGLWLQIEQRGELRLTAAAAQQGWLCGGFSPIFDSSNMEMSSWSKIS